MTNKTNSRVLVFLKPDCTVRRAVSAKVIKSFYEEGFKIVAFKEVQVDQKLAEKHYEEHKGKFFYPWLCKMIQFSPVIAMIMEEDPNRIREFIGETFCHKADNCTLRGKYGIWGGVNSIHASDSLVSAEKELELWQKYIDLIPEGTQVYKKIEEYINKWDGEIKTDLQKVREICNEIKSNPDKKDFYKEELKKYLWHDCKNCEYIDSKKFDEFLDIIIENCLL